MASESVFPVGTQYPIRLDPVKVLPFIARKLPNKLTKIMNGTEFRIDPPYLTLADLEITVIDPTIESTKIFGSLQKQINILANGVPLAFYQKGANAVLTIDNEKDEVYAEITDGLVRVVYGGRQKRTPRKRCTIRKRTIKHKKH